jgi:hypothetical protein
MTDLINSAITSLDGYVADQQGNFDWAAPDEEVHAFVNDFERPIGTLRPARTPDSPSTRPAKRRRSSAGR